MSDQNPHPGDMRHSQIPVGCPTHTPPPASGLTLIGALLLTAETILDITQLCRHQIIKLHHFPFIGVCFIRHLWRPFVDKISNLHISMLCCIHECYAQ